MVITDIPTESSRYHSDPQIRWVNASSFSEVGFLEANAAQAKVALCCHNQDSHTLMAVLHLEHLTGGSIFTVSSYKEVGFERSLLQAGCDYCVNANELVAPILSQSATEVGLGSLMEQLISQNDEAQSLFTRTLNSNWQPCSWMETIEKLLQEASYLAVGLITKKQKMLVNPAADVRVEVGDTIIFLNRTDNTSPSNFFEPKP